MGNLELFNQIADSYDTPERIRLADIIAGALREQIVGAEDKTAVDYGCGTGLVGLQLLSCFKSMLLIDASENMVEQVRRKISRQCMGQANALCCDLSEDAPQGIKADYILLVLTLLHINKIEQLLTNLHTALNPGGRLLIVDFDKNEGIRSDKVHNGFDQAELAELLGRLSFSNISSKTFHHGEKLFMKQDASLFVLSAQKQDSQESGCSNGARR